jgi:hypothetical protein
VVRRSTESICANVDRPDVSQSGDRSSPRLHEFTATVLRSTAGQRVHVRVVESSCSGSLMLSLFSIRCHRLALLEYRCSVRARHGLNNLQHSNAW